MLNRQTLYSALTIQDQNCDDDTEEDLTVVEELPVPLDFNDPDLSNLLDRFGELMERRNMQSRSFSHIEAEDSSLNLESCLRKYGSHQRAVVYCFYLATANDFGNARFKRSFLTDDKENGDQSLIQILRNLMDDKHSEESESEESLNMQLFAKNEMDSIFEDLNLNLLQN